jgi:hypothetical protein
MLAKRTSPGIIKRAAILHLLCLGVLAFAFHAKLAVYKAPPEPSTAGSKLSVEKNSTRDLSAIGKRELVKASPEFRLFSSQLLNVYKSPLRMPADRSARIDLVAPFRLKDQSSLYFYRPPPILL